MQIKNKKIQILLPIFLALIIIMPVFVNAQGGFVPCGGKGQHECGYYDLMRLVNNIINWIIMISIPVAAGVFAWAGILYMTTGIVGKKEEAKKMLWKVFWGLVIILSAWLIVTTLTGALLSQEFKDVVPLEGA